MGVRVMGRPRTYYGRGDNLVVDTKQLAGVLRTWMERHDADHPTGPEVASRMKQGGSAVGGFTAKQYLVFHSGRGEKAVARILAHRTEVTTLEVAEAFLMAIDEEYRLANGQVRVFKDPRGGQGAPRRGYKPPRGVTKPTGC